MVELFLCWRYWRCFSKR